MATLRQLEMNEPVLVEVMRGGRVESRHRGALAVVDAAGNPVLALGAVERPVYPRSAVKALQALTLIESGAADRFGLAAEELALACASHGGEPGHVAAVESMLAKAGLTAAALRCGPHWPISQPASHALAKTGAPTALHNNCSGKHAGFLCAARAMGVPHEDYISPYHPVQRAVCANLASVAGVALSAQDCATDGCSVPTWAVPPLNLAHAFAKFGTGQGLSAQGAAAAARLRAACAQKPWYVAGTGRFCTEIMTHFGERVFVKTGAEGVYCAALPGEGLGLAVKCEDGAGRAAEVLMAALIARFLPHDAADEAILQRSLRPSLRNWNNIVVGEIRPTTVVTSLR